MNEWIEFVNRGVLNFVKTPFFLLVLTLVVIVALTAYFVIREIKNDSE